MIPVGAPRIARMVRIALGFVWPQARIASPGQPARIGSGTQALHPSYNLAGVPSDVLDGATKEAARILARAGIQTSWQAGAADVTEAHIFDHTVHTEWHHPRPDIRNYLVASIGRAAPSGPFPGALGYALPDAQTGVHAIIFYDRVLELTPPSVITLPNALGHGMAHEIGHVLLGSTEHSPAGIMKASWEKPIINVPRPVQ